jgi:hypothetical protein
MAALAGEGCLYYLLCPNQLPEHPKGSIPDSTGDGGGWGGVGRESLQQHAKRASKSETCSAWTWQHKHD